MRLPTFQLGIGNELVNFERNDWVILDPNTNRIHFMREIDFSPFWKELELRDPGDLDMPNIMSSKEDFEKFARGFASAHGLYAAQQAYSLVAHDDTVEYKCQ